MLVTAVAEPFQAKPDSQTGEFISLRASLQGSFTNISENKVPFSEQVNPHTYYHFVRSNPSRIEEKIRVGYTFVDKEKIDLRDQPNSAWFSVREIERGIRNDLPFNALFHAAFDIYRAEVKQPSRIKRFFRRLMRPKRTSAV